jgi:hypothetical protein
MTPDRISSLGKSPKPKLKPKWNGSGEESSTPSMLAIEETGFLNGRAIE